MKITKSSTGIEDVALTTKYTGNYSMIGYINDGETVGYKLSSAISLLGMSREEIEATDEDAAIEALNYQSARQFLEFACPDRVTLRQGVTRLT